MSYSHATLFKKASGITWPQTTKIAGISRNMHMVQKAKQHNYRYARPHIWSENHKHQQMDMGWPGQSPNFKAQDPQSNVQRFQQMPWQNIDIWTQTYPNNLVMQHGNMMRNWLN